MSSLIYLFGYPGVGKNTIAAEIERQSDFIAVQNHLLSNALRQVAAKQLRENYAAIEPVLKHHTMKAWLNFLEFVDAAAPSQNLILTSVLYENDPARVEFYEFIRNWAKGQNREFLPVALHCDRDELMRRLQSPGRVAGFKLTDTGTAQKILRENQLLQPENGFTLDITEFSASQAAESILGLLPLAE
ncbi:MAG: hypothetical protein JWM96_1093 [Alphaproteobacteria bacterium]|nr:hypothetical protein [Alphaproteobacteria bacterium]